MRNYTNKRGSTPPVPEPRRIELVVPAGLEALARTELKRLGRTAQVVPEETPGVLALRYGGDLRMLLSLRLPISAYLVKSFAVPRPKALLGDEHLRAALDLAGTAIGLHRPGTFHTLYLSAAGADSAVLGRLKRELAARLGLTVGNEDGDLLLRLRRSADGAGWDLLARLSPRPLATRAWRVCNREGALNGPVAHAMAILTAPDEDDVYLNVGCGTGTLLVERLLLGPTQRALGCDISPVALECARANLAAAGLTGRCELTAWDMTALPLPDASVDVITSDLPFGHLVGSHAENLALYPALLADAGRVARPDARCALLSHEVRLMERLLEESPAWALERALKVDLGGLFPRIFLLRRR
jgi:SAM-dependent methyltransferase